MYSFNPTTLDEVRRLCREYSVRELDLFGSGARGDFRADSDLDFLVEFRPDSRVGLIDLARFEQRLERLVGREVDLVSKRTLRESIRDEVLAEAVPIYHDES